MPPTGGLPSNACFSSPLAPTSPKGYQWVPMHLAAENCWPESNGWLLSAPASSEET